MAKIPPGGMPGKDSKTASTGSANGSVTPPPPSPDDVPTSDDGPSTPTPPPPSPDATPTTPPPPTGPMADVKDIIINDPELIALAGQHGSFRVSEAASKAVTTLDALAWERLFSDESTAEEKVEQLGHHLRRASDLTEAQVDEIKRSGLLHRLIDSVQTATNVVVGAGATIKSFADFVDLAVLENPDLLTPWISLIKTLSSLGIANLGIDKWQARRQAQNAPQVASQLEQQGPDKSGPDQSGPGRGGPGSGGPDKSPGSPDGGVSPSPESRTSELALGLDEANPELVDPDNVIDVASREVEARIVEADAEVLAETRDEAFELDAWPTTREPVEVEYSVSLVDGQMTGSQADHNGLRFRDGAEKNPRTESRSFVAGRDNQHGGPNSIANYRPNNLNGQGFPNQARPQVADGLGRNGSAFGVAPVFNKLALAAAMNGAEHSAPTPAVAAQRAEAGSSRRLS